MVEAMSREAFEAIHNSTIGRANDIIKDLREHDDISGLLYFIRDNARADLQIRCMCVMARYIDVPLHTLLSAPEIIYWRQSEDVRASIKDEFSALMTDWIYHYTLTQSIFYKAKPDRGWKYTYNPWTCNLLPDGRDVPYLE